MPDLKITALTGISNPLLMTDVLPIVDDPAGTPITMKVTMSQLQEFVSKKGSNVASAALVTLGDGEFFHITGTATITDIDFTNSWDGRRAVLVFDGSLILTHNATTLILPGGADIVTMAGDSATFIVETGDNIKCVSYERSSIAETLTNPTNNSTAAQNSITAATLTYITGSNLAIPLSGLKLGTTLRWIIQGSKTAVGTAATAFHVRLGTNGTTADAAILTFTLGVGTAAVDNFTIVIDVVIRGPLGASCIAAGIFTLTKIAAEIAGIITTPSASIGVVSGAFNSSTASLIAGVTVTSGATVVLSIAQVIASSNKL